MPDDNVDTIANDDLNDWLLYADEWDDENEEDYDE